jgi:hypothetical protein
VDVLAAAGRVHVDLWVAGQTGQADGILNTLRNQVEGHAG